MVVDGQNHRIPLLSQSSIIILWFLPSNTRQEFVQRSAIFWSYLVLHYNVVRNFDYFHPQVIHVYFLFLSLAFHFLRVSPPRFFSSILLKLQLVFILVLHVDIIYTIRMTCLHGVFSFLKGSDFNASDKTLLWQKVLNLFDTNILGIHINTIPQQYFLSLLSYFE